MGGEINAHLCDEETLVEVDEMHFTNVIFNLFDNALKYASIFSWPEGLREWSAQIDSIFSDNGWLFKNLLANISIWLIHCVNLGPAT